MSIIKMGSIFGLKKASEIGFTQRLSPPIQAGFTVVFHNRRSIAQNPWRSFAATRQRRAGSGSKGFGIRSESRPMVPAKTRTRPTSEKDTHAAMRQNHSSIARRNLRTAIVPLAIICSLVLATPSLRAQGGDARPTEAYVIMISVDGLVPEYYTAPAPLGLKVPNLTEMKLNGAYAEGVEGIYPSVTYPAHTTLITGVRPASHGIVQNRIFEPPTAPQTKEWYWYAESVKTPTLYALAKKAGLRTAAVGWPVTVKADIDDNVPEIFDPLEAQPSGKRTLQYATPGLFQKALAANPTSDATVDGRRTAISEFIIKEYKPRLMLIHLVDLDSAHHTYGPRSPKAL